jgi:hypothetical protein
MIHVLADIMLDYLARSRKARKSPMDSAVLTTLETFTSGCSSKDVY